MTANPEQLVELMTVPNEIEAGVIRAVLSAEGIDSWMHMAPGMSIGVLAATTFMPTTIKVRQDDLERANAALDKNREDSIDLDWNEVDVGQPEDPLAVRAAEAPRIGRRWRWSRPMVLTAFIVTIAYVGAIPATYHWVGSMAPIEFAVAAVVGLSFIPITLWVLALLVGRRRVGRADSDIFE